MAGIQKIIVTRHHALIEWLIKNKFATKDTPHIAFATIEDVQGKHVLGVLPNWLACHAEMYTELQLRLPKKKDFGEVYINGDLTLSQVELYLIKPRTYRIREVSYEPGS